MIAETIHALYPTVVQVVENDNAFTAYDENGNVVSVNTESQEFNNKLNELSSANNLSLLRRERNHRLAETDWWASSDLTMTTEQTNYRQALRDITDTYTSLDDVVWPTKP